MSFVIFFYQVHLGFLILLETAVVKFYERDIAFCPCWILDYLPTVGAPVVCVLDKPPELF